VPSRIGIQFISFACVGVLGFVVDATVLHVAMTRFDAGHYGGRLISYLCAATTTWALNRGFTFRGLHSTNRVAEWGRFLAANAIGGLVNYLSYAAAVVMSDLVTQFPTIGVAIGSVAGLAVNFTLSRRLVFKGN
jgi:putative flippase GtrA